MAKPNNVESHKDIYSFILEHFNELSVHEHSPIHALTYAIRRIIHAPSFLSRIPDLLDYLWHVDKFRKRAVEISSQIIIWQKFYKNNVANGGQVRLLSAKEEKMIAGFEDQKKVAGGREAFCECTIRCCRLHIYYLCAAEESCLLPARLPTFFPGLPLKDGEPERTDQFHWDFTKEERVKLDEAGRQSVLFVKEESEWEKIFEANWKAKGRLIDSAYNEAFRKEFAARFEPPYDVDETIQWIEAYLKRVENMVDKLEGIFNDSQVAGTRYSSLSLSALSLDAS